MTRRTSSPLLGFVLGHLITISASAWSPETEPGAPPLGVRSEAVASTLAPLAPEVRETVSTGRGSLSFADLAAYLPAEASAEIREQAASFLGSGEAGLFLCFGGKDYVSQGRIWSYQLAADELSPGRLQVSGTGPKCSAPPDATLIHSGLPGLRFDLREPASREHSAGDYWTLRFSAPDGTVPGVGVHTGAQRFSSLPENTPGLSVVGCGRGHNRQSGEFAVLDVAHAVDGSVRRFVCGFEQRVRRGSAPWLGEPLRGILIYRHP